MEKSGIYLTEPKCEFNTATATATATATKNISLYYSRNQTAVITDRRIRVMNEIIAGMKIIKMYMWEKPFAKVVSNIRR